MNMDLIQKGHVPNILERAPPPKKGEKLKLRERPRPLKALETNMIQSMKNNNIQNGHVPKILGRGFAGGKRPLRERPRPLKALTNEGRFGK